MHLQVLFHNPVLIFWGFFFCSILADFVDVSGIFVFGVFFFSFFIFIFIFLQILVMLQVRSIREFCTVGVFFLLLFFVWITVTTSKKTNFPSFPRICSSQRGDAERKEQQNSRNFRNFGNFRNLQAPHPIEKGISRTKIQIFLVAFYFLFQPFGDEGLGEDPLAL